MEQGPALVAAGLWVAGPVGGDDGGRRVVLVHGTMDRSATFVRAIRHLRHHAVVRYDRRGYGRSRHVGPPADVDGHVDDLVAVLDGRPSVVVGHSLGGVVALTAAARRPDLVLAVGAFEAPTPWVPWWPATSAGGAAVGAAAETHGAGGSADTTVSTDTIAGDAAERFMRRMVGDARWEALPAGVRAERRREGPAMLAELRSLRTGEVPFDPADLAVPVLAGRGSEGRDHHRRAADELARATGSRPPVVIDGAQHGAHLTHPEAFAAWVDQVAALAD